MIHLLQSFFKKNDYPTVRLWIWQALKTDSEALAGVAQWMNAGLQTKVLLVQFPVRAYAWAVGHDPHGGGAEGQLHIDVSLFLPPLPSL